jgi:hypothetical protein
MLFKTQLIALILASGVALAAESNERDFPTHLGTLLSMNRGERTFVEYRFSDKDFKPYVQVLRSPGGINVLRDRPYDHVHHRGLMFAVNMNDIEFWGQTWNMGSLGQQRYRTESLTLDTAANSLAGDLSWRSLASGKTIMEEHRRIQLLAAAVPEATVLAWRSTFKVPAGHPPAVWKGEHYHGLGLRFAREMDESTSFFFAADARTPEHVRGVEYLTRASWAAYHALSEGKPVTVAMFDAPGNPRFPAHWFTMYQPFSFLSATINTHRDPFVIPAGRTTHFDYGIAACDGHLKSQEVERVYRYWLEAIAEK